MNDGVTHVLWRSDELASTERFRAQQTAGGWQLDGLALLPLGGEPAEIRYRVELDASWRTRRAGVEIAAPGGSRTIAFAVDDGGRWTVDGAPAGPLDGCVDVDLGFTPATNTLQIRRLGLEVGESRTLPVAWLAFPELTVQALTQTYTRVGDVRWRYGSAGFEADLTVDPGGYVLRYGDLWSSVAYTRARTPGFAPLDAPGSAPPDTPGYTPAAGSGSG